MSVLAVSSPALSLPAMSLPAVSLPATIAAEAIDFVLALVLPLILPRLGDADKARTVALRMLAAHHPQDERDLQLAAEAVGFSIRTMAALAEAADPASPPERQDAAQRRASSLNRSGLAAQRFLGTLQRERRNARRAPPPFTIAPLAETLPLPAPPADARPSPAVPAGQPAAAEPTRAEAAGPGKTAPESNQGIAAPQALDVPQAEAALRSAQKLLDLMQAHHKGAPSPHTKAAQDIQQQRRIVEAARLALAQVRGREAALARA